MPKTVFRTETGRDLHQALCRLLTKVVPTAVLHQELITRAGVVSQELGYDEPGEMRAIGPCTLMVNYD